MLASPLGTDDVEYPAVHLEQRVLHGLRARLLREVRVLFGNEADRAWAQAVDVLGDERKGRAGGDLLPHRGQGEEGERHMAGIWLCSQGSANMYTLANE